VTVELASYKFLDLKYIYIDRSRRIPTFFNAISLLVIRFL